MQRLSRAGFRKAFVHPAILPDWWDKECANDQDLLPDIEIRVARFLGIPIAQVKNAAQPLTSPQYAGAQLRRVRDIDKDQLAPAIHSALRIGAAVVRSLEAPVPPFQALPSSALVWRQQLQTAGGPVALKHILDDLWMRGIPVVPLDILPSPSFQGIACIVEGRPIILLGHRHDEPGRVACFLAHEAGHISAGDCAPEQPVVDEEYDVIDDDNIERKADSFARKVLVGDSEIPSLDAGDFKQLAKQAAALERSTGIDAGFIIFTWAAQTRDYVKATMAVKALYRAIGARRLLREYFDKHIDLDGANESDRALLRCVYGDPEADANTH